MGKKVFEVEISNTGPKGYETATILGLPATRAEFQDALQKARIEDSRRCRNELVSVHFAGISSGQIGRDVDLLELNFLAERLTLLDADGRKGLEGLIQMEQNRLGTPIPLSRFINLTFHTDLCRFAPGVSSEKELGTFLYENEMLPQEAMALLDTAEPGSRYQTALLEAFGQKYSEDQKGVFTHWGYAELDGEFQEVYKKGEMAYFSQPGGPIVLEVFKGFFDDPGYDNDRTAILQLPASDEDLWRAVEAVDAASPKECGFRCVECMIPALRAVIGQAIDEEEGIEAVNEFARELKKKSRVWDTPEIVKYKALLEANHVSGLQEAEGLMHHLDEYELLPEIGASWDYAELVLREEYPGLPAELFQTGQAAQIGQRLLAQNSAALTEYGLLRRKDRLPLEQEGEMKML